MKTAAAATLALLWCAAAAAQTPATLSLTDALARATQANRTIVAARTARAIDVAGVDVAREHPNPELAVEEDKETPHWAVGATLPIETAGKRGYRMAQAQQLSDAARFAIGSVAWQVRSRLRAQLLKLYAATQKASILKQQI